MKSLSAEVTIQLVCGCLIGELLGPVLAAASGVNGIWVIVISIGLAIVTGLGIAGFAVTRSTVLRFSQACRALIVGEIIGITVILAVIMAIGSGMMPEPLYKAFSWTFWEDHMLALPIGFFVAWPINHLFLKRSIRRVDGTSCDSALARERFRNDLSVI